MSINNILISDSSMDYKKKMLKNGLLTACLYLNRNQQFR